MSSGNLTPLGIRELGKIFDYAVVCINGQDARQTWQTLEAFYATTPPDVQKECTDLRDEINLQINILEHRQGLSSIFGLVNVGEEVSMYLRQANLKFYHLLVEVLTKKGLLQWHRREVPSNVIGEKNQLFDE